MLQYFDTLTDDSGNSLLGATVAVTNYPSGTQATIYATNGTTSPIANATVSADITGQISFFAPDGAYTLTYAYKGTQYKVRSPVQFLDPMGFVAATDTGTANNLIVAGAQYSAQKYVGLKLEIKVAALNSGPSTLVYQGDAGFPINQPGGTALVSGMLQPAGLTRIEWDGVQWQLVGSQSQPFYAQTAAEIAAGVVPVNFFIQPGDVRRSGYVGNGSNDDTASIQNQSVNGVLFFPPSTAKITAEITLNNVAIYVQGAVLITGTGSIRGVLRNDRIPHAIFQVPYNLVTAAERQPVTTAGNYYLDPLLGVDTNNGTTPTTPIRTLAQAATLIASVAASASALTLVLRSGRYETSGLILTAAQTLTSGGNVTWTNNAGEIPIISAPTKWFFKSSAVSATFGAFTGVANPLGYAFFDLYDAETGIQVPCASNEGSNYSLPRNQVAAVTLNGTGPYTISITINTADTTNFGALSGTEKAGVRLRLNGWFTSMWSMSLALAGSVLTGECQAGAAASASYYNGWNSDGIDTFGCPYLLQNMKSALDGTNFCAFSDNVWLPKAGTNYFTVDNTVTFLIDTGAAAKHIFEGVKFRYQAAGYNTLKTFWSGGPFPRLGMLIGSTGQHTAQNCDFEYGNLNGVSLAYTNATVTWCRFTLLGLCGVTFNNATNGSDGATLTYNKVRRWGNYSSLASIGLYAGGVGVTMNYNDCREGPWTALRFETRGNITSPSGNSTGNVLRNVLIDVGYRDGAPADAHCNNDSGVLTIFGNSGNNNVNINENVVGRGFCYGSIRGIFADQGISGIGVYNNLCWGTTWYGIDFRQVSGLTFNNSFRDNVVLGRVNIASTNGTTDFSGNLVGSSLGNNIDSVIANTFPNYFGVRCIGTEQWPSIQNVDNAYSSSFLLSPNANMTPFVRSFLRTVAFIDDQATWESLSIPLPITTATYTVVNSDKDLRFNRGSTVTVTLPTPATCPAREIYLLTLTNFTVVSASANVVPLTGGAAGTAILAATAGKWVRLVSDASAWNIVAGN